MTDSDDLARAQRLVAEAMPTLLIQTEQGRYPYDVQEREPPKARDSMSTISMVAYSLATLGGYLPGDLAVGGAVPAVGFTPRHEACLRRAARWIVRRIVGSDEQRPPYSSRSFGNSDPLTLTWLVALFQMRAPVPDLTSDEGERARDYLYQTARELVTEALPEPDRPVLNFGMPGPENNYSSAVLHPLPLLRTFQLSTALGLDTEPWRPDLFDWFDRRLYKQLSLQGIEYSELDVADVVFSLEGLLAIDRPKVTAPVVDGVCRVVEEVHRLNPTLRPVTPFKTSAAGAVHLFSSVEVFSSLLRSVVLMDEPDASEFFTRLKPVLRNYLAWLQGTRVSGRTTYPQDDGSADGGADPYADDLPGRHLGWESEHVHTEHRIVHVWLTSQVLLYLHGYQLLLERDVARQALGSVALRTAAPSDPVLYPDPVQLPEYRVASRLEQELVAPHRQGEGSPALYSCLLYGPPGTGKTTLARWVADRLGWPLLTITTSDFIVEGEAQVEARAKRIFDALSRQRDVVIFFDEVDRLVLDRDAAAYRQQGDMLQFMTPSMLTKINDLRAAEQVVFIVGTNHAESIDAAIKRPGRIDVRLLVLPPDLERRRTVLRDALEWWCAGTRVADGEVDAAAREGAWRTVPELHSAVRRFRDLDGELRDQVRLVEPAVSLSTYRSRITGFKPRNGMAGDLDWCPRELLEEAFLLAYLWVEGTERQLVGHDWLKAWWTARREVVADQAVRDRLDLAWPT